MNKTYTLPELLALDNDALNKMAAELRGYRLCGFSYFQDDGDFESRVCHVSDYTPTDNFNQSRELLMWAMIEHDCFFNISIGDEPFVEFIWPDAPEMLTSRNGADWREIPGDSARAEVAAFCAAMLAVAGRLSDG
jgi:hypothetical protein